MDIFAAVSRTPGAAFSLEQVTLEAPRDDEILVRIVGVGLCHSDLLARDGIIPVKLPAVFGHEGSGHIVAVGNSVRDKKVGDRVILSFNSCGACKRCHDGDPAYCSSSGLLNYYGSRPDGTTAIKKGEETISSHFFSQSSFASYALVAERNAIVITDEVPLEIMGPLGCGFQTGAGAVMNTLACKPGSSLLIMGGGSLGLSAVLAAIVQGCTTIIVSEPHESRRTLALDLGATHVIDPKAVDVVAAVREVAGQGVDYAFDTTGSPQVAQTAVSSLAVRGTLVIAGVPAKPDSTVAVTLLSLVGQGQTIKGVVEGDSDPAIFIPYLVDLYRKGHFPFDKLITKYPFEQINQAVYDHHHGVCVKAVLIPSK